MSVRSQSLSLTILRWTLGVVVLWESWQFATSAGAAHMVARMGLPHWIPSALGGVEIFAAILFLIPKSARIGGYALLAIFLLAAMIHILHGQREIGGLFVYAAAVYTCLSGS